MVSANSYAISFKLDSIAQWGAFPRFCIGVYRWGDKFFNSYDSTYVVGTGYKFNIKASTDSWTDYYDFRLENDSEIQLMSEPCTSTGAYLTYMAVTVGYDINVSNLFGSRSKARKRFNVGFSCSLLSADVYFINNDVGTRITKFTDGKNNMIYNNLDFNGIDCSVWGLDAYYFFNNKKYSQPASFAFSKRQLKSAGSFFAGISYWSAKYNFNFSGLPPDLIERLPETWTGYQYNSENENYALRLGYGYNWVAARNLLVSFQEAPTIGLRRGFIINHEETKSSVSFSNRLRASIVYNRNRWFFGVIGSLDTTLAYDKSHTLMNMIWSVTVSVGYRFNIW
ncbi:MAG: DUF4421 domain-containing protein [Bacteroides sp.]|nr:DUF4421 domain-containing protein [Bacteroides sp.]